MEEEEEKEEMEEGKGERKREREREEFITSSSAVCFAASPSHPPDVVVVQRKEVSNEFIRCCTIRGTATT